MKVTVFDTHTFDRDALEMANSGLHDLNFLEVRLSEKTALLANGSAAVCCFANDKADAKSLEVLAGLGVKLIALRSAGYNHVDLKSVVRLGLKVVRVPEYSPYAVAEYALALLLCHNRKIHRAHDRVRELNFSLDGLIGFDVHGKTIGIIGTGRIGRVFAEIMTGFGCRILLYDKKVEVDWAQKTKAQYVELDYLLRESDIISLHVPLNVQTKHLIDESALQKMKNNAIIVNTGRGGLIDTVALISALKKRLIGGACLDVYEEEEGVFFSDFSDSGITDDVLARLLTFPNVLITSHQAFLTREALKNIADTTISSITKFEKNENLDDVTVSFQK